MPRETQSSPAEFGNKYSVATRLVAVLGFAELVFMNGAAVLVRERDAPHGNRDVCVGQSCGEVALRDLLAVAIPTPEPASAAPKVKAVHEASKTPKQIEPMTEPTDKPAPKPIAVDLAVKNARSQNILINFVGKEGVDISWPQCEYNSAKKKYTSHLSSEVTLPKNADFFIVGVTGGHADDVNPCLAEELQAAQKIAGPNVSAYINTGNSKADPKKAEKYGKKMAIKSLRNIERAAAKLKYALQPFIWLDVERGEWQPDTAYGHASNVAFMGGMIETVEAAGVQPGIYTAKDVEARPIRLNMWEPIMGTVPSKSVLNVPEWISSPGADGCTEAPFIERGMVVLRQNTLEYPKGTKKTLDFDGGCRGTLAAKPAVVKRPEHTRPTK